MAESIKEQILAAVATAIGAIDGTGGYQTNLVGKVYRDYQAPVQVDEDLAVIVKDRGEADRRHLRLVYEHVLTVELEAVANEQDPAQLNKLLGRLCADVERKVAATETWGGLAVRTYVTESRVAVSEASNPVGVGVVTLEIWYRTAILDPYASGSI